MCLLRFQGLSLDYDGYQYCEWECAMKPSMESSVNGA